MTRLPGCLSLLTLTGLLLPPAALAQAEPASERAHVVRSERGRPLTPPSRAGAPSVATDFLRGRGHSEAALRALRTVSERRSARTGLTHVRLEQEVAGLRVVNAYAKAAVNARGQLVHLVDALAPLGAGLTGTPRVDEAQALRAALDAHHPGLRALPALVGREGNSALFARDAFFHAGPRVERVAIPMSDGTLQPGFLVETWSERDNLLHETLVSGEGRVLSSERRTNTDRYNIFPVHPDVTPQRVVRGPGAGNAESPLGWLGAGAQTSWNIAGNNVHAYLDTDASNSPDPGGTRVTSGNFLTEADLAQSPSIAANRDVAVQNLFFLNNVIHDELYRHGFDEAAGNFQENNFGRGGKGSDSVDAEAQDGEGTDNANFATPSDGKNPRMQMFLWTGKGSHQVVVHSPAGVAGTYLAAGAEFGPALTSTGVRGDVVLADDGVGTTSDACEPLPAGPLTGRIALIDRGTCAFTVKVKNAQLAGAVAAIVANNAGDSIIVMGGVDATITIPSVFIGRSDGATLRSASGVNATVRLADPPPLMRDGDLDSDIVWHEYGHGLTWRMIGRMSGPLSGAIGEGMADVLAVVVNENDVVGEYSFNDPIGIRRAPYTNYPLTYGDVTGAEVHDDGEVYGAIGWRLWEVFQRERLSKDTLLGYLVEGMNFTPAGPSFEDMRDGILQAVAATASGHECLVWEAFAQYGVGVGASARVQGARVLVTESFALPAECAAGP